ncbi:hypothetical protein [Azospirillum brasilense]|uniref:Uncharacterized protein n=1 Tax=Azospirillum brasilense TaxID=192 RepID=A0A235H621_AZOBR|nr:hypothetical protein [Azospirillum brasilense]OYD80917.1 hypothetical protein CHT98_28850 [Azospirillum brasilense]
MVAVALETLGVFMGESLEATGEDNEIGIAIKSLIAGRTEEKVLTIKDIFGRRDAAHPVWGFKIPNIFRTPEIFEWLEKPVLIFIFRDTIAISQRMSKAMRRDPAEAVASTGQLQAELLDCFLTTRFPALGFSYEKVLHDPAKFVDELIGALGLSPTPEQRDAAIAKIMPSPEAYLKISGNAQVVGQLERFQAGYIYGWALDLTNEHATITVQIEIDGTVVGNIAANLHRGDLLEYCRENFHHGFQYKVPASYYDGVERTMRLSIKDASSVRIGGQDQVLKIPAVFGVLEDILDETQRGWVYRHGQSAEGLMIRYKIDDQEVATVKADYPRDDLEPAGFIGAAGVCVALDDRFLDGNVHKIEFEVEGVDEWVIEGSPRYVRFPEAAPRAPEST